MRDYGTGDILYKLNLNHPIISVGQADYRGNGANDLILCTTTGEVRGYERSKINLNTMKCSDQDELLELLTLKKVLLAEISHYESNEKINHDKQNDYEGKFVAPEGVGVIPSNTRLQIAIYNNIEGDDEVCEKLQRNMATKFKMACENMNMRAVCHNIRFGSHFEFWCSLKDL